VKRCDGNEIPCRKTGGWNIGRALGERDDVTRQEFERESEFTAEGRGVRFTYELWGHTMEKELRMSKEEENKAVVGRWFKEFWGNPWNPDIVDELAAPDILLQYSLHEPRRGRKDVKEFMIGFRDAFPDLNFWGAADLIAEGDYVVGRWEGGGTHTGSAFDDFIIGSLPAASGRKMRFTGITVLRVESGKIAEEVGLDDGATALQQLNILRAA
jgi:predicted ester cyclase